MRTLTALSFAIIAVATLSRPAAAEPEQIAGAFIQTASYSPVAQRSYTPRVTIPIASHTASLRRGKCFAVEMPAEVQAFAGKAGKCLGGRQASGERMHDRLEAAYLGNLRDQAAYAHAPDPKKVSRSAMGATAGLALPLNDVAFIGVQYNYSEQIALDPSHFSLYGHQADELSGHSATVRLQLQIN